jgi:hypothetical protein
LALWLAVIEIWKFQGVITVIVIRSPGNCGATPPARPTPSSGKGPKPNVARLVDKPPMSSATPETKQREACSLHIGAVCV